MLAFSIDLTGAVSCFGYMALTDYRILPRRDANCNGMRGIVCYGPVRDIIHRGLSVPLGSLALRIRVFRATWFFVFANTEVLSPKVMLRLSGVMRIGEICLRLFEVLGCLLARGWLSESVSELVGVLYFMSIRGLESDSRFHVATSLSIALFSFFSSE